MPVYGIIVLMVYGWTMISFFWELPSWHNFLTFDELLKVLTYSILVNFLESLVVLCLPVLLSIILPKKWFYDSFISRGALTVILGLGYLMYFIQSFDVRIDYPNLLVKATPLIFLVILLIAYIIDRVALVRKIMESFADRTIVFIYISLPLSILSLCVVVFNFIV